MTQYHKPYLVYYISALLLIIFNIDLFNYYAFLFLSLNLNSTQALIDNKNELRRCFYFDITSAYSTFQVTSISRSPKTVNNTKERKNK